MKRIALIALALGAVASTSSWADTKISALPSAIAQTGTEVVPEFQSGQCASTGGTCGVLLSQIKTYTNSSLPAANLSGQVIVANGGTGLGTLTTHGVLIGEGTSNIAAVAAMSLDTLLQGQGASADPAAVSVNNCGDSSHGLSYSTTTHTFGCQTITGSASTAAGVSGNVQYNNAGSFAGVANGTSGQALISNGASAPSWGAPNVLNATASSTNGCYPIIGANSTTPTYDSVFTACVNPGLHSVSATTFNGALNGNASTATLASTLTSTSSSTNAQFPPLLGNGTTVNFDSGVLINPSTHDLSATTHTGAAILTQTTVAGLPTCNAGNKGRLQGVTDANAPTYNATVAGGGAVIIPVYCNGTNWTAH